MDTLFNCLLCNVLFLPVSKTLSIQPGPSVARLTDFHQPNPPVLKAIHALQGIRKTKELRCVLQIWQSDLDID